MYPESRLQTPEKFQVTPAVIQESGASVDQGVNMSNLRPNLPGQEELTVPSVVESTVIPGEINEAVPVLIKKFGADSLKNLEDAGWNLTKQPTSETDRMLEMIRKNGLESDKIKDVVNQYYGNVDPANVDIKATADTNEYFAQLTDKYGEDELNNIESAGWNLAKQSRAETEQFLTLVKERNLSPTDVEKIVSLYYNSPEGVKPNLEGIVDGLSAQSSGAEDIVASDSLDAGVQFEKSADKLEQQFTDANGGKVTKTERVTTGSKKASEVGRVHTAETVTKEGGAVNPETLADPSVGALETSPTEVDIMTYTASEEETAFVDHNLTQTTNEDGTITIRGGHTSFKVDVESGTFQTLDTGAKTGALSESFDALKVQLAVMKEASKFLGDNLTLESNQSFTGVNDARLLGNNEYIVQYSVTDYRVIDGNTSIIPEKLHNVFDRFKLENGILKKIGEIGRDSKTWKDFFNE